MKKQPLVLFSIILFLVGCGGTSEQATEESAAEATEVKVGTATQELKEIEVNLKGVYATSTKLPQTQFGYENLFDGNNATIWSTMAGAGPDEGIMLYFEKPQTISELEIINAEGNAYSKVTSVKVYVNGQSPQTRETSERIVLNKDEVQSLYIRIEGLSDLNKTNTVDDSGEYLESSSFVEKKSAGIASLSLFSNGQKVKLILPTTLEGIITASSTLAPEASYGVRNLFDSRKEFAWVEGVKGNGEGESITIKLTKEIDLTSLIIANGFQRSSTHFNSNARLKSFEVSNEKGESAIAIFKDELGEQNVMLDNPLNGNEFTFTIKETYAGTKYQDLVISEMKLVSNGNSLVITNNETETLISEVISKTQNTILDNYVDRRVSILSGEMEGFKRSIILRSDYTFVVYQFNWTDNTNEELIADGNWEIKKLEKDYAKVRVFGKLVRNSTNYNPYEGDSKESQVQIFQDFLEVSNEGIKGAKFIPEIKRMTDNGE